MSPKPLRAALVAFAFMAGGLFAVSEPAAATGPAAGAFVAVDPVRILDTRPTNAVTGITNVGPRSTPVGADQTLVLRVAGAGGGAVPSSGAGAVVLNVTVTGTGTGGYVTVFPSDASPRPTASNLNFVGGQTIANHVTVKLSATGEVSFFNRSDKPVDLIADVAGWYAAGDGTLPGTFNAMAPKRLLQTFNPNFVSHLGKIGGNQTVDFQVGNASGTSIPADAAAAVLNLTVANTTSAGYVSAYPADQASPPLVSNVNYSPGQAVPNAATVKLGGNPGAVRLFVDKNSQPVDLIADASGWFTSGTATVPGSYTAVTPKRILDTRPGSGNVGGLPIKVPGEGTVTLAVAGANDSGVPAAQAAAAVLNVTATNATEAGYVTAYPAGANQPLASNLNFNAGQTVANLVTVKLSADGKVKFYNGSKKSIDLIADVAGWYKNSQRTDVPAGVLNLAKWRETLPIDSTGGTTGTADNIDQPQLASFELSPWFENVDDANPAAGVRFRANTGGARTSSNTQYPRSELREMEGDGTSQATWTGANGKTNIMTITQAITHTPDVKKDVVAGQIHDSSDDIIEIQLKDKTLWAWHNGQSESQVLDADYQLGETFKVEVRSDSSGVKVSYWNPVSAASPKTASFPGLTTSSSSWYFKAGCYPQSNTTTELGNAAAYGEVIIYGLTVEHRDGTVG